jgi:hypothetical protein
LAPVVAERGAMTAENLLTAMGYQRVLLVEVPLPDPQIQPELAKAIADLEQAQRHMLLGQDRDAVGSLRDALEQVSLALGDNAQIPADVEIFSSPTAGS